jgi:hypothetical protein
VVVHCDVIGNQNILWCLAYSAGIVEQDKGGRRLTEVFSNYNCVWICQANACDRVTKEISSDDVSSLRVIEINAGTKILFKDAVVKQRACEVLT